MRVYVFQAALHCEDCGDAIKAAITPPVGYDSNNESSYDSDWYPKGPYPDGGGESDYAQHCDTCGVALDNPVIPES